MGEKKQMDAITRRLVVDSAWNSAKFLGTVLTGQYGVSSERIQQNALSARNGRVQEPEAYNHPIDASDISLYALKTMATCCLALIDDYHAAHPDEDDEKEQPDAAGD